MFVFFCLIAAVCATESSADGSEGLSSSLRADGIWEIVYVVEAVLPSGEGVTRTEIRGPIEAEAMRLCETGLAHLDVSPVSIVTGPGGRGLVLRTTGLATCKGLD